MMPSLSAAAIRYIIIVAGIILLGLAIVLGVHSCDVRHNRAAQQKVEQAQAGAYQNSAADAVNAQSAANQREADSEALTRTNERNIRDAQGANDVVNPDVRDTGFASLCKRPSFRNSPTGRVRCPPAS